jgi:galactose mutarotase-like enzyme
LNPQGYCFLEEDGKARAVLAPDLGGWLLGYARCLEGRWEEVLHWSRAVVDRYPQEMYAGNPVLFPLVSKNRVGEREHHYVWQDRIHPMPQHGLARRKPWAVVRKETAAVTLELTDDADTRLAYPFHFRYLLTYRLEEGRLHWEQKVENPGPEPLPFSSGFHPYIYVPPAAAGGRAEATVHLPRCRVVEPVGFWENTRHTDRPSFDLSVNEPFEGTLFFTDLARREISLTDPERRLGIRLNWEGAPAYRYLALWTRSREAPFFCLEPWTALPNSFNRKDDLVLLEPGEVFQAAFWLDMEKLGKKLKNGKQ